MRYGRAAREGSAMNEHARGHPAPATYQDVLDAPPHMVAELVEGVR